MTLTSKGTVIKIFRTFSFKMCLTKSYTLKWGFMSNFPSILKLNKVLVPSLYHKVLNDSLETKSR